MASTVAFIGGLLIGLGIGWIGSCASREARLLRKILAHLDPEDSDAW